MTNAGLRKPARRTGPGRLSAEDAAQLNDRLLDAAFALFNTEGYEKTTMEAIARNAGASTKTVYSRYENKGAILSAAVTRLMNRILSMHAMQTGPDPATVEPRFYLTSFGINVCMTIVHQGTGMHRLAFSEAHRFPELQKFFSDALAHGISVMRKALEAWQKAGTLPHLPDLDIAAPLLLSILTDRIRLWAVIGKPLSDDEIKLHVDTAVDMFLSSAGYRPKS